MITSRVQTIPENLQRREDDCTGCLVYGYCPGFRIAMEHLIKETGGDLDTMRLYLDHTVSFEEPLRKYLVRVFSLMFDAVVISENRHTVEELHAG